MTVVQNLNDLLGLVCPEMHVKCCVTLQCEILRAAIIGTGSNFCEEEGNPYTLDEDILKCYSPKTGHTIKFDDVSFQQVPATAHTARESMQLMREHFPERLIFYQTRSSVTCSLPCLDAM